MGNMACLRILGEDEIDGCFQGERHLDACNTIYVPELPSVIAAGAIANRRLHVVELPDLNSTVELVSTSIVDTDENPHGSLV